MRPALRPHLNRLVARLMCWVLLFGWMAGAANACILQPPLAATAVHAAAHGHAGADAGHQHHHDAAAGGTHDDHGHDDEAPPGQPACKRLCDSEQNAVVKSGTGDTPATLALAAVTTGACVILPAAVVTRVPRPDAGALPAPPPIPIAFLRLTI